MKKKVRNKHELVLSGQKLNKEPWVTMTGNYALNAFEKFVTFFDNEYTKHPSWLQMHLIHKYSAKGLDMQLWFCENLHNI